MSITRASVIKGPGTVKLGTVQMFDRDQISANLRIESFDVPVSAYGNVDTRRRDVTGQITFRPCGRLTAAILGALYPHGTPSIGSSIFGSTDTECIIHSLAGQKVTFHAAALSRMPSLKLSTIETAFSSQAEIMAVIKNATDRTTANSFYTQAGEAWSGAFDVADILGGVYSGVWGTGETAVTFKTAEGWTVDFDMAVSPQYADGVGTYDALLTAVTVRAKCRPMELSESTMLGYLNLQGATAALGGSLRSGKNLVISCATGLTVTLYEVALMEGPLEWGTDKLRIGEIGFVAHRAITEGVPAELFSVALTE